MKTFLFDDISTCCEGMSLLTFGSIPAVLLTNRLAFSRNTDESVKRAHLSVVHRYPGGQQVKPSGQQVAKGP